MKKLATLILVLFVTCSKEPLPTTPQPTQFTLTVSASEGGSVSTAGGTFNSGSSVTVTATPNSGYQFVGWSNGATGNPLEVIVTSNQTLVANFEVLKYVLTVNIEGEGTVSEEIVNTGRTTEYNSGSSVKLTATPSEGWTFDSWTGKVNSSENPITISIEENSTVTANFTVASSNNLLIKSFVFNAVDINEGVWPEGINIERVLASTNRVGKTPTRKHPSVLRTEAEFYDELSILENEINTLLDSENALFTTLGTKWNEYQNGGIQSIEEYIQFQDILADASDIHDAVLVKRADLVALSSEAIYVDNINLDTVNQKVSLISVSINETIESASLHMRHLADLMRQVVDAFEVENKEELTAILSEYDSVEQNLQETLYEPAGVLLYDNIQQNGTADDDRFDRLTMEEKLLLFDEKVAQYTIEVERFKGFYEEALLIDAAAQEIVDNLTFNFNKNFAITLISNRKITPEAGYRYSVENAWRRDAYYGYTEARVHAVVSGELGNQYSQVFENNSGFETLPTILTQMLNLIYEIKNEAEIEAPNYPAVEIIGSPLQWPNYDTQFNPLFDFTDLITGLLAEIETRERECGCTAEHNSGGSSGSGGTDNNHNSGGSAGSNNHNSGGSSGKSRN